MATAGYDPFGSIIASTGTVTSPLGWEGEYQDPATALDQLAARDLNPATGQFLTQDPLGPSATSPMVSPYAYASDQPTVLADPTGDIAWGADLARAYNDASNAVTIAGADATSRTSSMTSDPRITR